MPCYKIKRGTQFDHAVKEHFALRPKWEVVSNRVSDLLGEKITRMAFDPRKLRIDITELKKEENRKLFKKDGYLKANLKKAKELQKRYQEIIAEEGLTDFLDLGLIHFMYGVMRYRGESMEMFRTSENDIYYKTDFDLEKRSKGMVESISEVEYHEVYLSEIKKQETASV